MERSFTDIQSIRESKGLTLKAISELTKISIIHLESIENGAFHLLPPPVYAKSFIKKYAEIIGIESTVILNHYENFLEATYTTDQEQNQHSKSENPGKKIYLFVGIIIILIIGLLFILFIPSSNRSIEEKSPTIHSPAIGTADDAKIEEKIAPPENALPSKEVVSAIDEIKADKPAAQPDVQPVQPPAPNKENQTVRIATKPYVLIVEAKELTWIKITGDDETEPYDALLKPGEKIERTAKKGFLIKCGNAGGVDIVFQGKSLGPLGKHGKVVHLQLP